MVCELPSASVGQPHQSLTWVTAAEIIKGGLSKMEWKSIHIAMGQYMGKEKYHALYNFWGNRASFCNQIIQTRQGLCRKAGTLPALPCSSREVGQPKEKMFLHSAESSGSNECVCPKILRFHQITFFFFFLWKSLWGKCYSFSVSCHAAMLFRIFTLRNYFSPSPYEMFPV